MKNNRKGFTLIEMLVVVAIVGLLSSVVVVGVGGARQKARDAKRVADVRQIQTWFETKYTTQYPDVTIYPAELPSDPSTGVAYSICRSTDNQGYGIGVTLEAVGNRPSGGIAASQLPEGCSLSVTCAATGVVYCVTSK
ncbi:MAG: prepilin-type N-terminal cleavage/methylation domain-containing protein [Candidatus Jorgensenbacteria bacterium]|nr:prepilin-type N-terminal cleavage/methylation domain-containing protein [Candidatus Jorgensenbacteria bacterium]